MNSHNRRCWQWVSDTDLFKRWKGVNSWLWHQEFWNMINIRFIRTTGKMHTVGCLDRVGILWLMEQQWMCCWEIHSFNLIGTVYTYKILLLDSPKEQDGVQHCTSYSFRQEEYRFDNIGHIHLDRVMYCMIDLVGQDWPRKVWIDDSCLLTERCQCR